MCKVCKGLQDCGQQATAADQPQWLTIEDDLHIHHLRSLSHAAHKKHCKRQQCCSICVRRKLAWPSCHFSHYLRNQLHCTHSRKCSTAALRRPAGWRASVCCVVQTASGSVHLHHMRRKKLIARSSRALHSNALATTSCCCNDKLMVRLLRQLTTG